MAELLPHAPWAKFFLAGVTREKAARLTQVLAATLKMSIQRQNADATETWCGAIGTLQNCSPVRINWVSPAGTTDRSLNCWGNRNTIPYVSVSAPPVLAVLFPPVAVGGGGSIFHAPSTGIGTKELRSQGNEIRPAKYEAVRLVIYAAMLADGRLLRGEGGGCASTIPGTCLRQLRTH